MNGKDIKMVAAELDKRLSVLEKTHEERWYAHNKRAKDMRMYLSEKIDNLDTDVQTGNSKTDSILNKISALPCAVSIERFKAIEKVHNRMWVLLTGLLLCLLGLAGKVLLF